MPVPVGLIYHTCATLLLGQGVHPKLVQEFLGQTTIAMTLDTYSHYLLRWATRPPWRWARSRITARWSGNCQRTPSLSPTLLCVAGFPLIYAEKEWTRGDLNP